MQKFDVAVIGGGPGGYSAAIRLGQLGKSVVLFEKNRLGGECLNYGCIPTKTYINIVKLVDKLRKFQGRGVTGSVSVDLPSLKAWKDSVVNQLSEGVDRLCKSNKVTVIRSSARLAGNHEVEYDTPQGKSVVNAENIVLATGSKPIQIRGFEYDGETVVHNWHLLDLKEIPARLVIVGGGVLGMEFAFMFSKMGCKVTVIELMPQILPGTDAEVASTILDAAVKSGIQVHLNAKVKTWTRNTHSASVVFDTVDGERQVECDKILVSVGRRPASDGLGLEEAGVKLDSKGFVVVNSRMQTSVESVYAVGDLVGAPLLAHKAYRQGAVAAEAIAGLPSVFDSVVPDAVFTDPEAASVGLDLARALSEGYDAASAKFPLVALGRAVSVDESKGFVKVVYEKKTGSILGVQIVAANASDMVGEAALAVEMGANVEDVGSTIHVHPTYPEALMEASDAALGKALHMVNRPSQKP